MSLKDLPDQLLPKGSLLLVTGATGYIASNVVREALDNGYRVRGTVRSEAKVQKTKKLFNSSNYEAVIVREMEPANAFDEAVKGVDAIIHLASPATFDADPNKVVKPAVNGAVSIMNSALKEQSVKRFVFTSSSCAATVSHTDKKVKIDGSSWITGFDEYADYPPPYTEDKGFGVYVISKAKAERAVWDFVKEKKPHYVVNAVLPNFNMGRLLGDPGITASLVQSAYNGKVDWDFPPQYMIDVIDDARIHLAAAFDGTIANERIFAFATAFNWNDVLDIFRELRPNEKFVDNQESLRDLTEVDNKLGADLLTKWWGQNGYKGMKESLRQNIDSLP